MKAPRRLVQERYPGSGVLLGTFLLCVLVTCPAPLVAKPKINEDAKRLAGLLAPASPARSPQKDAGAFSGKMISILEILEKSYRSNGPPPESLVSKALEFRADMGRWETMLVTNAVLSNWREASALGLFGENGSFGRHVRKGRGVGQEVVFEHIVPAVSFPEASNQMANLRLVREEERRKPEAPLSIRENAYREQLAKMLEERSEQAAARAYAKKRPALPEKGPVNALGQTRANQERLWNEAVAQAGAEAVAQLPAIRVRGRLEGGPSHMSKHRWRVRVYVENLSSHPTEVEARVWLLGYTWKKRDTYVMAESKHPLKLRPGEGRMLDLYTRAEGSYKGRADDHDGLSKKERARSRVRYRGFAVVVEHEKGVAGFAGSDQRLTGYVDPAREPSPLRSMPRF